MNEKKYNLQELRESYPEYGDELDEICKGRLCSFCPLRNICTENYTLEKIDEAYSMLFGQSCDVQEYNIQETDILSLLGE